MIELKVGISKSTFNTGDFYTSLPATDEMIRQNIIKHIRQQPHQPPGTN